MESNLELWRTSDGVRWFLLPAESPRVHGELQLRSLTGAQSTADAEWVRPFEVSEEQARRWASNELGESLQQFRKGLDKKLAEARLALDEFKRAPIDTKSADPNQLNSDAAPALLDFLKSLPGVIGQSISGDPLRVDTARNTLTRLQQRLRESGIDVDDRMKGFADRLASIRTEADKTEEKS